MRCLVFAGPTLPGRKVHETENYQEALEVARVSAEVRAARQRSLRTHGPDFWEGPGGFVRIILQAEVVGVPGHPSGGGLFWCQDCLWGPGVDLQAAQAHKTALGHVVNYEAKI